MESEEDTNTDLYHTELEGYHNYFIYSKWSYDLGAKYYIFSFSGASEQVSIEFSKWYAEQD